MVDGISSGRPVDRLTAFRRMEAAGAHLISCESMMFDMIKDAKNPLFKSILGVVKDKREVILEDV